MIKKNTKYSHRDLKKNAEKRDTVDSQDSHESVQTSVDGQSLRAFGQVYIKWYSEVTPGRSVQAGIDTAWKREKCLF